METTQLVRKENRAIKYFKDSFVELRKVTWPTRSQAVNMVILVVIISLLVGGFIAALDYIFTLGYNKLMEYRPATVESLGDNPINSIPVTLPTEDPTDSGTSEVPAPPQ